MNRFLQNLLAVAMIAVLTTPALASIEVKLKDGSRRRGSLNDQVEVTFLEQGVEVSMTGQLIKAASLYLIVEGDFGGQMRQKTVFRGDVISMSSASSTTYEEERPAARRRPAVTQKDAPLDAEGRDLGVFVMPMKGMVGLEFRHQEIKALGEYIDANYPPGQTIVILIESNGGMVVEQIEVTEAIEDLKKNHRVVAWVKKAISAGCSTAMSCDEIFFMTEGTAGSVTTLAGGSSLQGDEAERHVEDFVKLAKKNGYSEHIARAMKLNKYMCSYDKDPETGEVTFYGDLTGEFDLSNGEQNLTFNSKGAMSCGFSKGTADTGEDLAELLHLPRWHELSPYGRELADDWQSTCKRASEDIPLLMRRYNYYGEGGGDALEVLGKRLQIMKQLLRWAQKSDRLTMMNGAPQKEQIELEIESLRKQIAAARRRP